MSNLKSSQKVKVKPGHAYPQMDEKILTFSAMNLDDVIHKHVDTLYRGEKPDLAHFRSMVTDSKASQDYVNKAIYRSAMWSNLSLDHSKQFAQECVVYIATHS
jgi:hypothetical protein